MQDDEVKRQLASLRAEVQALGHDLHRLRQEDLRAVYSEQIRSVLEEKVQQHFSSARAKGKSGCGDPAACAIEVTTFITRAVSTYKESGLEAGMKALDGFETHLEEKEDRKCVGCAEFKRSLVKEVRNYLDISVPWRKQLEPGALTQKSRMDPIIVQPEEVEVFLAPLSSAVRVRLMMLLKDESMSLAEMSRRTALVKGHLQFHLRSLTDAGLVDFDRRTKVYDLSTKGERVLDGVLELMHRAGAEALGE